MVKEVHLGYTLLIDEDETEIMVPNRHIVGEVIKNSHEDMLIETAISVEYGLSPQPAIALLNEKLANSGLLSPGRPIKVGVERFADSGIDIGVRVWAATESYYSVRYRINELIYDTLLEANINVPYPRRDVHLFEQKEEQTQ